MVEIHTFGTKHRQFTDLDLPWGVSINCQHLPNPYHDTFLRSLDGRHELVHEYVFDNGDADKVVESALKILLKGSGVALYCRGGKHRSVAVAEKLSDTYEEWTGSKPKIFHWELESV